MTTLRSPSAKSASLPTLYYGIAFLPRCGPAGLAPAWVQLSTTNRDGITGRSFPVDGCGSRRCYLRWLPLAQKLRRMPHASGTWARSRQNVSAWSIACPSVGRMAGNAPQ